MIFVKLILILCIVGIVSLSYVMALEMKESVYYNEIVPYTSYYVINGEMYHNSINCPICVNGTPTQKKKHVEYLEKCGIHPYDCYMSPVKMD